MTQSMMFHLYFQTLFLVMITYFLSYRDRSFNLKTRLKLHLLLLCAVLLVGVDFFADSAGAGSREWVILSGIARNVLCPMLILLWIYFVLQGKSRWFSRCILLVEVVNLGLFLIGFRSGLYYYQDPQQVWLKGSLYGMPVWLNMLCLILFLVICYMNMQAIDPLEYMVVVCVVIASCLAAGFEKWLTTGRLMDGVLVTGICVYYYYLGMQTYKRDALTKLLNRHNFNYDLEELQRQSCSITIMDIDNFKMINDKYGHSRGDEALVTVTRVIKSQLLRRCRLYRYGGDEFAIISQGVSTEALNVMLERINKRLEEYNYRISYGIAEHYPEREILATVDEADSLMYRNKRRLKSDSIWDDMTGLYNLRGFIDELENLKKFAWKSGKDICLLGVDVDQMDDINQAYGYLEGNMIIATLAEIISGLLETGEFAGHLGSDDFILAFMTEPNQTGVQEELISKLAMGVKHSPRFDGKEYTIELNTLAYPIHVEQDTVMESCVNKTLAMKRAEKESRKKADFYKNRLDDTDFDREEEALALDIIRNNRLRYALQPIVSAKDGRIVAYEALMRAEGEQPLSPLALLRYASRNNVSYEIERLTFFNVLERVSTDETIPPNVKIFINSIPGFTLTDEDYRELVEKYPYIMNRVVIEITEQSELDDDALTRIKNRQNDQRFGIAIDDFGSGNSNTYTLLRYRPDYIKLDRLLISDIDRNTKKQYFVNSIITFAKENGMQVLAEGVETEAELKMMIRLQVDLIQGYCTARPAFETIRDIPESIKHVILNENIRGVVEGKKKIYTASSGWEISLVQLALDEYTGITVSAPNMRIVGNTDCVADMCIKIKDGLECRLTLKDVCLSSIDDLPCIELGEGAQLTLLIEGNCSLNYKGIHVPEGSSLMLKGNGNMVISAKGHDCYGIGCGAEESVGSIGFNHSGKLSIRVDGEKCAAIGGGSYKSGSGIAASSGEFDITVAGVEAVGIGSFYGDIPIQFMNFLMNVEFRVNTGTAIGSVFGMQNIDLGQFAITMVGSGSRVSGIGSNNVSGGYLRMSAGALQITMSGQEIHLLGIKSGKLSVSADHAKMALRGEGDRVMAMGSWDQQSMIQMREAHLEITINASEPKAFGAMDDSVLNVGPKPAISINA